jgi:hypothetical protein
MRLFNAVIALLLVLALGGCAKPLPPERAAYVGQWRGPSMELLITQDGRVLYRRVEGSTNTKIDAPLKEFVGNDFVVGVGPMSTKFVVSVAPHQDGADWKMTVDGVELTK